MNQACCESKSVARLLFTWKTILGHVEVYLVSIAPFSFLKPITPGTQLMPNSSVDGLGLRIIPVREGNMGPISIVRLPAPTTIDDLEIRPGIRMILAVFLSVIGLFVPNSFNNQGTVEMSRVFGVEAVGFFGCERASFKKAFSLGVGNGHLCK
jgi:hypothetical protein